MVTAQYLLNYARTEEELLQFCKSIYKVLKPGGTFAGVTTWAGSKDSPPKCLDSTLLGWKVTMKELNKGMDEVCKRITNNKEKKII